MDKAILLDYVRTITGECGQRHGADIYFHSPLHADNTPSFVVHPSNKWHDFAINTSGDVIDLCQRINNCDYKQALFFLSQGNFVPISSTQTTTTDTPIQVTEIANSNLFAYANNRCVSASVLRQYCKEIHQGNYYYIGFPSALGGWELRNVAYKGCIGKKSYSHIKMGSDKVMIFEGFFDFLSFRSLTNGTFDAIVLNTTAMVNAIIPLLDQYRCVHTYLDNDQSGRSATERLIQVRSELSNHSPNFAQFNDVNEFICKSRTI